MQANLDRKTLADALEAATKIIPSRVVIDILKSALLRADGEHLTITTTNLDMLIEARLAAEIEIDGAVAVNGHALASFAASAAGETMSLAVDGNRLIARSDKARTKLPILPAMDFPTPFEKREPYCSFELEKAVLADVGKQVGYAADDSESGRYYLEGVYWHVADGKLAFCATDGHILSLLRVDLPAGAENLTGAITPAFHLPKFASPVSVSFAETSISLAGEAARYGVAVTSKLIDGTFPDYQRIIPTPGYSAVADRKALQDALFRCRPIFKVMAGRSYIDLEHGDDGLTLSAYGDNGAEAQDTIEAEGDRFCISLGPYLLAHTLDSFDEAKRIAIGLTGPGESIVFTSPDAPDRLGIVMPMRGSTQSWVGKPPA